jgi:hypothetical protein
MPVLASRVRWWWVATTAVAAAGSVIKLGWPEASALLLLTALAFLPAPHLPPRFRLPLPAPLLICFACFANFLR